MPKSLVGKNLVPEGLTIKTSFKQRGRRYKLVASAEDERFKALLDLAEAQEATAPAIVPGASSIPGAEKFRQHVCASLLMSTEAGSEARSIVDNTPRENGGEEWRRIHSKTTKPQDDTSLNGALEIAATHFQKELVALDKSLLTSLEKEEFDKSRRTTLLEVSWGAVTPTLAFDEKMPRRR